MRDGLMPVGDAARHTQPVTGGGIIPALEGGTIAGAVACEAIRRDDVSARVLREYENGVECAIWESAQKGLQDQGGYYQPV